MLCVKCKSRESTGVLVHLCDPCFDQWEASVNRDPKSMDVSAVDPSLIYRRYGGEAPDDVVGVKLAAYGELVEIEYVKADPTEVKE